MKTDMKKIIILITAAVLTVCLLYGCGGTSEGPDKLTEDGAVTADAAKEQPGESTAETDKTEMEKTLHLYIDGAEAGVEWENSITVDALKKLASSSPLKIRTSAYGGFEQVGPLGVRLPSEDSRMTTRNGDIVLYSGDQIVIFYGSNTWSYTKLGHISLPAEELTEMLKKDSVDITLKYE